MSSKYNESFSKEIKNIIQNDIIFVDEGYSKLLKKCLEIQTKIPTSLFEHLGKNELIFDDIDI